MDTTVTITTIEYLRLLDDSKKLAALEAGGVDNWEWYSESLEQHGYFKSDDESEDDIYGP